MKSSKLIFLFLSFLTALGLSVLLFSCKNDLYDCMMKSGRIMRSERKLPEFVTIRIEDNIDVVLRNDTSSEIAVEAGEELIAGIETTVSEGMLILRNTNTCNWVRNMKIPVRVFIPVKKSLKIDYKGYGNVSNEDTLLLSFFQLDVRDGSGSFNILMNTDSSFLKIHEGVTDVNLAGNCDFNYIYNNGIGPVRTSVLSSNSVVVHHKGPGDCYVKAVNSLDVTIEYSGNIFYEGNPAFIKSIVTGTGKLIRIGK